MPELFSRDAQQGGRSIQRQIFKIFSIMKPVYIYLYVVYNTSLCLFTYEEPNTKKDHIPDEGIKEKPKSTPIAFPNLYSFPPPHVPYLPSPTHFHLPNLSLTSQFPSCPLDLLPLAYVPHLVLPPPPSFYRDLPLAVSLSSPVPSPPLLSVVWSW